MSEVNTDDYKRTPIAELAAVLDTAKYDPTLMTKVQFETMQNITNGEVMVMDPTHPAVTIMEMDACMHANNIQETIGLLRRMYPALAETQEDLYLHMSDDDYLNRFATPATTKISFAFLYSDLMTKLPRVEEEKSYKVVLPRDTQFRVDGVDFMLLYPVIIRRYETGAIQITYDSEIKSPLLELDGIVITPTIRRSPKMEEWLFFEIDVIQISAIKTLFTLDNAYNFRKDIAITDKFYFGRAYYQNSQTGDSWVEMKTTHTDQIFDSSTPTVIFTVFDQFVRVEIPIVYMVADLLSGSLRIDLFTTKGGISMNMQSYVPADYTVSPVPLDQVRDSSIYSDALADLSYYVFSTSATAGGKRSLSFEELRARVIYNAIGPQSLPITNNQNVAAAENRGFEIVKNIDVLTNRQFLATRKLPTPSNPKLITAANIGMITFAALLSEITSNENVIEHHGRYTILSNSLFKNNNGRVSMLRNYERDAIFAMGSIPMVNHINDSEYFYIPFHYVLDETEPEFDLRAYYLDKPHAKNLSFERQNKTLQLSVNTESYMIEKIRNGYRLTVQTVSGAYYQNVADSMVGIQLAFKPYGEERYAYIEGTLVNKTQANERIFSFDILTDYDITSEHLLGVTNAKMSGITNFIGWISLETEFSLIHYAGDIPQSYVPDETDSVVGKFLLDPIMVGNCLETLIIHFGDALDNLWRRNHSYSLDVVYRTYQEDVPLFYTDDVFDVDENGAFFDIVDDEIVYRYKNRAGEPVLDADDQPVLLHERGDVVLDEQMQPIKIAQASTGREMDLLVVDGRYYFADDTATVLYRQEIAVTMANWITNDIEAIKQDLLEQTWIYFYPKTTLGSLQIQVESGVLEYTPAEQQFQIVLHVKESIYNNETIRTTLENATISLLDEYISQRTVNMTEIREKLKFLYGDSVSAFRIAGLGGTSDFEIVTVMDGKGKLCLKKKLVILPDMTMFVKDAADFDFRKIAN